MLRDSLLTGYRIWGVRRVRVRTIAGIALGVAVLGVIGLWNWGAASMAAGAAVVAVAVPKFRKPAPEEISTLRDDAWAFAGERIAFRSVSEVLDRKPREIADRLAARYRPGQVVEMVLWIVATDGTGQPWTLVQDRYGDAVPSVTATAVGLVPGACDPYLEAQRLSLAETGLALADVVVVGWGTDTSLDKQRDVIMVIGQTSVGAEQLGSHEYEEGLRRSHLVELHPESVARSLTSVDARRWQAAAVRGLVRCLELLYPGAGPLVEELAVESWRSRRIFSRLGRLTEGAGDREGLVVNPVVLKVIDGGLTQEPEERAALVHDRALSWEATPRAIPTRYH